jgi:hypothetical protein
MDIPYVYSDRNLVYTNYSLKMTSLLRTLLNKLAKKGSRKMVFTRFPYYNTKLSCKTLALKHNEGNCVAFAFYMKELLKQHNIKGYIIGAKSPEKFSRPGYREINHACVIVPYSTGYVLFDTAFYFHKAIVLDKSTDFQYCNTFKNVYSKMKDEWCFQLMSNTITVKINNEDTTAYYQIKELLNPQKSITIHTNEADKTIFRCEINNDFTSKLYYKINLYNNTLTVESNQQPFIKMDLTNVNDNDLENWIHQTKLLPFQKKKLLGDVKPFLNRN